MSSEIETDILYSLEQNVVEILGKCGNCAQTSFLALEEQFDLDGERVLRALTPFPGIALRGETCGAVTGCLMALGLVYGRDRENLGSWRGYRKSLPPARRFCRRFENKLGSTMCGDIVEAQFGRRFDLADRREAMEWMQCGALEKCAQVIDIAVRIAAGIIIEERMPVTHARNQ